MGLAQDRYTWGGPRTKKQRDQYKTQLIERFVEEYAHLNGLPPEVIDNPNPGGNLAGKRLEAEAFAYDKACALIDRTAERVTDKSVGLLQVMALSAAILTIAAQTANSLGSWYVVMTFLLMALTSFLLLLNMLIAWYGDKKTYRHRSLNIDRSLHLAAVRSRRLTRALYLSILVIAMTGLSLYPPSPLANAMDALANAASAIDKTLVYVVSLIHGQT